VSAGDDLHGAPEMEPVGEGLYGPPETQNREDRKGPPLRRIVEFRHRAMMSFVGAGRVPARLLFYKLLQCLVQPASGHDISQASGGSPHTKRTGRPARGPHRA